MEDTQEIFIGMVLCAAVVAFLLNIIMALAVNGDAKRLRQSRGELFLFGPKAWAWTVFVFSIAVAAMYRAMHHLSLRSSVPAQDR